jgi:hypothetical protein
MVNFQTAVMRRTQSRHLAAASDGALMVSVADKLHILRGYRSHGDELRQRSNVRDPQQHLGSASRWSRSAANPLPDSH